MSSTQIDYKASQPCHKHLWSTDSVLGTGPGGGHVNMIRTELPELLTLSGTSYISEKLSHSAVAKETAQVLLE